MAITYPLTAPATPAAPRHMRFAGGAKVGNSASPFTFFGRSYAWQGDRLAISVELPPMKAAVAEAWVGWRLALNGSEGSFPYGPAGTAQQGTWAGASPLVRGASQTGRTLIIDGLSAGATGAAGDWFQLSSGASARLHKVTQPFTADGSGIATVEIFPRLREAPADNAPLTLASPKGRWQMVGNDMPWDIGLAGVYGIAFDAVEDLRPLA